MQNRVKEIRHRVHPDRWHHCPGISNPADLPSRGLTVTEWSASLLWQKGPDWLSQDSTTPEIGFLPMPELCSVELKSTTRLSHNLLDVKKKSGIGDLMRCEDFSDIQRLLRVTAFVIRAATKFKAKRTSHSSSSITSLVQLEIAAAKQLWVSHAQTELVWQKDFNMLKGQLGLFADEKGLW